MATAAVIARASSRGLCARGTLRTFRAGDNVAKAASFAALQRYYASKSFPPHTVVPMPALSPTMTSGNIGAWQKKPGDSLSPGDVLVEIETDKAQMDFEFQEEAVLAKILKENGEKDVAVGNPIAVVVEDAGDVEAFADFTIEDAGGDKSKAQPDKGSEESKDKGEEAKEAKESKVSEPSGQEAESKSKPAPEARESESTGERLELSIDHEGGASPAAKKLALEKGVPLSQVKGTGPNKRITKQDVEKFSQSSSSAAPAATPGAAAASYEDTEVSGMRKTIAARLRQSMNENPHYFVASTVSVSKLLKLRTALNASAEGKYKLSINDFLIKAVAIAAHKVPAANSSWREEGGKVVIRKNNVVDVSVAVATPVGLLTPIVKNVNGAGLESISASIKELGKRARDGKLKPEEYQGGTITISNMGMNDAIDRFTAVINPPQSTIVAVGAVKKVAVPKESEEGSDGVEWDEQIVLTGSFDHKVVDGAVGGDFMKELKKAIENPLNLML
ncbi:dihydrolipoamide acetyltransferase [Piedraia hortae CBS 480.64]|uniref:Acetyltransferase component of pyruvate dehydrogenase complex n=1 Tax=Piedraia hortae CBS 480.64 TaxID=1314780 RepID=A0A6A7C282_9PEZI|nr:dihydrolipoamide acetyltransferase [Piedraia hortae CBS 480.64]